MAVRAKVGLSGTIRKEPKPKTTSIGMGRSSRPRRRGKKNCAGKAANM
jgi:hypothetical protein